MLNSKQHIPRKISNKICKSFLKVQIYKHIVWIHQNHYMPTINIHITDFPSIWTDKIIVLLKMYIIQCRL